MSVELHKLANRFGLHTAELLLFLRSTGAPIDQCWPVVSEHWVDALRQVYWEEFGEVSETCADDHKEQPLGGDESLSAAALKVLQKLHTKGFYGNHKINRRTLANHYCRGITDLDTVIRELARMGYLTKHDPGTSEYRVSLNASARKIMDSSSPEST